MTPDLGAEHRCTYGQDDPADVHLFDDSPDDQLALRQLRLDPCVQMIDSYQPMIEQLLQLRPTPSAAELAEPARWVFYPWQRALVSILGPASFRRLRLDRNRNKITTPEQARLGRLKIGVVGLSVGHAIAHTLAVEGLCAELRLADFDSIELSNLNRIPASILDLGVNKATVTARRIAEIDPYLPIATFTDGLTERTMAPFLDGLDLIIDECDSLDIKVRLREEARARGIPVLMETSDRGLFDVERFDLEPDRPLFHGLLGAVDAGSLAGLSIRDKAPQVMRILQAPELSARMAASMVEIDSTMTSWPQLGGDVQLGAATVAAAVRRLGRGDELPSGRLRVDLDQRLAGLVSPAPPDARPLEFSELDDLTFQIPQSPMDGVIQAIRLAPSGGNSQPWTISRDADRVDISLAAARTSAMDVGFRGSYVAIGAAGFNARVAAAECSAAVEVTEFPSGDIALSFQLGVPGAETPADLELAAEYPAMIRRISNRHPGRRSPIAEAISRQLQTAARAEGGSLRLLTAADQLAELADILAESDRLRYLTPLLHRQMIAELKWPGRDRLESGIDVRTLGLDTVDLAKLQVASRNDVMSLLATWGGGRALGDSTRDRINASSGVAVITVTGDTAADYLHGGAAAERVWVSATRNNLDAQPISPVFLYARSDRDRQELSADFAAGLAALQDRFTWLLGLRPDEVPVLVLRLTHDAGPTLRSARLPLADIVTTRAPLLEAAP